MFFGEIGGKIKFEGDVYTREKIYLYFYFEFLILKRGMENCIRCIYLYLSNGSLIKLKLYLRNLENKS